MQNLALVPTYSFRMKSTESFINETPDLQEGFCDCHQVVSALHMARVICVAHSVLQKRQL